MNRLDSNISPNPSNAAPTWAQRVERCGICEQESDESPSVYWANVDGGVGHAHPRCFTLIRNSESHFYNTLFELFGDQPGRYGRHNEAHALAVEGIRRECGCSIRHYFEQRGEAALTDLFSTFGVHVAQLYAEHLAAEDTEQARRDAITTQVMAERAAGGIGDADVLREIIVRNRPPQVNPS
ncbi:MAG: hypothetical protein ACOYKZ_07270, partial [Chlamydiia bacterium]